MIQKNPGEAKSVKRVSTFGERLRTVMDELNVSYEQFGRLVGERPQTLNRYIRGVREPRSEIAMNIALRLGVNLYWLQGYDVPRDPQEGLVADARQVQLPILGVIRAGIPTLAEQEILGYAPADRSANPETDFYLRVRGDSMRDAGIREGDLVQCRQQSDARNGQIVACVIDQEDATLKRYFREGDRVILRPENPDYEPIEVPAQAFALGEARIVGVAVRLVRDL